MIATLYIPTYNIEEVFNLNIFLEDHLSLLSRMFSFKYLQHYQICVPCVLLLVLIHVNLLNPSNHQDKRFLNNHSQELIFSLNLPKISSRDNFQLMALIMIMIQRVCFELDKNMITLTINNHQLKLSSLSPKSKVKTQRTWADTKIP